MLSSKLFYVLIRCFILKSRSPPYLSLLLILTYLAQRQTQIFPKRMKFLRCYLQTTLRRQQRSNFDVRFFPVARFIASKFKRLKSMKQSNTDYNYCNKPKIIHLEHRLICSPIDGVDSASKFVYGTFIVYFEILLHPYGIRLLTDRAGQTNVLGELHIILYVYLE